MKVLSTTKKAPEIERAASKDAARPILTYVHLNTELERLEATNSYVAAVIPVEVEEGDESGLIPVEAIKAQRKASKSEAASLTVNGDDARLSTPEGEQSWRKGEGTFPDIASLEPENLSDFQIGLNPKYLLELAQALGSPEAIKLQFIQEADSVPSNKRGMRVTPLAGDEGAFGILMPIRVE